MTRLAPELFTGYRVRPVDHYPQLLLSALHEIAPAAGRDPTVVVWTPGPANSAYFEHSFLARQMGVELVEAGDLVVRDDICYMRTTEGLARVDAIYRRLDDDFIDPLEFRPDSLLGVPGLIRAYRAGTVALANAVGTGVADDKAVYAYVPEMIRYYLGEEPLLDNVRTYLLRDPEQLEYALVRLDTLVVKPTGESGGKGVYIGPRATDEETARQRQLRRRGPGALDRPGGRVALDHADRDPARRARPAARRPAPLRGLRLGAADRPRRAHARCAHGGRDDRQLLARRRLEGHLGALRGRPGAGAVDAPTPAGRSPTCRRSPTRAGPARPNSNSSRRAR